MENIYNYERNIKVDGANAHMIREEMKNEN